MSCIYGALFVTGNPSHLSGTAEAINIVGWMGVPWWWRLHLGAPFCDDDGRLSCGVRRGRLDTAIIQVTVPETTSRQDLARLGG